MVTYPNQKTVIINRETDYEDGTFTLIGKDEWRAAANILSYRGYKLWMYLSENSNQYPLALSPKDIKKSIGLSESVYRRAVEELMEHGYLVLKQGNIYDFIMYPKQTTSLNRLVSQIDYYPKQTSSLNRLVVETDYYPKQDTYTSLNRPDNVSQIDYIPLSKQTREIYKYTEDTRDNNGHCVPLKTTPSASSETLPTVAPAEKKQKKRSASKKGAGSVAKKIAKHCCCSAEEIEGIVNNKGYDYDALLRCVENGYINGENHYSKKYWESMDADSVLRDPTYEEYLASMYKSNPNGLDEVKTNNSNRSDNGSDITLSVATENNNDGASMDIDWLADVSSWTVE